MIASLEAQDAIYHELRQFIGSETLYQHWTNQLRYTEGVKFLAERCGAYWLIDAIASWQPKALKDTSLAEFQLWELMVKDDSSADLVCSRDSDDAVFRQKIPFTDCPLALVRLYVEGDVLLLPSEH